MSHRLTIKGSQRSDGFIRFTSDELPGFSLRLPLDADKSAYESGIKEALSQAFPFYTNSQMEIRVMDKLPEPQNLGLDCHICHKPITEEGSPLCSYPHKRLSTVEYKINFYVTLTQNKQTEN